MFFFLFSFAGVWITDIVEYSKYKQLKRHIAKQILRTQTWSLIKRAKRSKACIKVYNFFSFGSTHSAVILSEFLFCVLSKSISKIKIKINHNQNYGNNANEKQNKAIRVVKEKKNNLHRTRKMKLSCYDHSSKSIFIGSSRATI